MKRPMLILFFAAFLLRHYCAGTNGGLNVLHEPETDTVLVLGAILIENIDMDVSFSYWDYPLQVVILGKSNAGTIQHYTVTASRDGYFCLPNVPQGSYLIKAIIFQEPGKVPGIITNKWDHFDSKFYLMRHPERGVSYTANWFPTPSAFRIINKNILWFGLKQALMQDKSLISIGDIMVNQYDVNLKNERLWTEGYPYTRLAPLEFYKQKFPESSWWK